MRVGLNILLSAISQTQAALMSHKLRYRDSTITTYFFEVNDKHSQAEVMSNVRFWVILVPKMCSNV